MDRILKILKKENGPRASSASALELNTIIFKHVYWYMQQISGERLQDHWSSGFFFFFEGIELFSPPVHMHSFLFKTSIQHFLFFCRSDTRKTRSFFDFRVFIFGKQEKNIRVGEFLTGSVGLPETFFFFFLA